MSKRRPYIPDGCDQQGRLQTGRFLAHEDSTDDDPHLRPDIGAAAVLAAFLVAAAAVLVIACTT